MYTDNINNYIAGHEVFTTKDIRAALKISDQRKAFLNTELARLEKKNTIKRIARGIYVVPKPTCFGISIPGDAMIANKLYMENDNGYSTGPTFLNQIGISTWMPGKSYIRTNNWAKDVGLTSFVIKKPRTNINAENKKYLQTLDCLEDIKSYAVDCKDPYKMVCAHILDEKIDIAKLLLLGHKFYKEDVMESLYIILEDYYETA